MRVVIRHGTKILWLLFVLLLGFADREESLAVETRGVRVAAKDSASGQTGEVKLYNKSYAVIIGIDKYQNLPKSKELIYAVRDAKGMEQVLRRSYGFDAIHTLYDGDATKARILRLLMTDLPKEMDPEDSLFVFWAGHGNQESTRDGEIGYLIPYDGSADEIDKNITMDEIKNTISRKIPAKHVFYVMDACYSGLLVSRSIDQKAGRDLSYLKKITAERVRQVLTAGGKDEEVLDGGPKGHSVFTGRLIELLEARGDFITANEIQAILIEKVFGDAQGFGKTQTPSFGTLSGSGDYVFVPSSVHLLEERKAEQERIALEIEQSRNEQTKIAREIADAERLEAAGVQARSDADQRKGREEKQRLEGLQRLAKIRQQGLEEEQRRKAEEDTELRRIEEERQQRIEEARRQEERLRVDETQRQQDLASLEQQQKTKQKEEEQHLVALRQELDAKRKKALAAADVLSIDNAVAEIKAQSARIEEIRAEFADERKRQEAGIEEQHRQKVALLEKAQKERKAASSQARSVPAEGINSVSSPVSPKDEFETEAECRERLVKAKQQEEERRRTAQALQQKVAQAEEDSYNKAVALAKAQRDQALSTLASRIEAETVEAIKPFQERVTFLANKEYTLDADALSLQLGAYDAETQAFPVSITNLTQAVQVAVNGTIPLPREAARIFKQQYTSGLVRPEVGLRGGDGQLVRAALINEADNARLEFAQGTFMTLAEREERARLRESDERAKRAKAWLLAAGMELVSIPGGEFKMGNNDGGIFFKDASRDEGPEHVVRVTDFQMVKSEVTQRQWVAVMGNNPSSNKGCDDCPVENVSWDDAQEFARKASQASGLALRLPTEAEWEYAARGGSRWQQKWAGTDSESELGEYAWYKENANGKTHPVCQKKTNAFGLCDMSGNVWEWCQDWHDGYTSGQTTNPMGPSTGTYRVYRGGGWYFAPGLARAAFRARTEPGLRYRYGILGFRLVVPPGQQ